MIGVSQLSQYEAAALYPDATSDAIDIVATGLWLEHVLQVYTSCMVSLVGLSQGSESILNSFPLSKVTLAVWDWIVCLPGKAWDLSLHCRYPRLSFSSPIDHS